MTSWPCHMYFNSFHCLLVSVFMCWREECVLESSRLPYPPSVKTLNVLLNSNTEWDRWDIYSNLVYKKLCHDPVILIKVFTSWIKNKPEYNFHMLAMEWNSFWWTSAHWVFKQLKFRSWIQGILIQWTF